jgi:hypothetical protein
VEDANADVLVECGHYHSDACTWRDRSGVSGGEGGPRPVSQ